MKKLFRFFKNYKKDMFASPIFKVFETISEIAIPLLVAQMIDTGVANHDAKFVITYGCIVIALYIVGITASILSQKFAAKAATGIAYDIRKSMYEHINTFSHKELDKFGTASLNNRMTHDIARVQNAIGSFLRIILRSPLILIGSIICAMVIDIKLSLIFIAITPIIVAIVLFTLKITDPLYNKAQKSLDKVSDIARENLQGVRVVRAFNKQADEERRFVAASKNLRKTGIQVTNISSILAPLTTAIINFAIIAIMWFGGLQVNIGSLSQGEIVAFVNYMTQISSALITVSNMIVSLIKAQTCAKRINEVFDTKPSVVETNTQPIEIKKDPLTPKIEFQNVSFAYNDGAKYAIKNLNLKIMPGQTIGIIGGTGSGKSSIINLIPRFYDASQGSVFVDGVNVNNYSFHQLRSKIGLVPQKAVLFKGSLKDNLRWRKQDATMEEIVKAVKISQSEEFVNELDGKYEYKVQSGGKNFSGGQRQRLTIARALVGDPEIVIMDDSASALDFATDAALRKAIKNNIKSTVILVSQRAGTVKNADQIVVLDGGNVVGIGKHADLLKSCPVYKEIYESQTK